MAESQTTSSQSNCLLQPMTEDDEVKSCPQEVTKLNKSDLQSARTNMKGSDQSFIPVQTNLHRLIQNKLRRKKTLPNSTLSANDAESRKKRLRLADTHYPIASEDCDKSVSVDVIAMVNSKGEERIIAKPPLPPRSEKITPPAIKPPSTRLKRKFNEQNTSIVQKLNAQTDQLRLEVTELKTALTNERNAVRALRAQNEAESRKSKAEIKKLQVALELSKKAAVAGAVSSGQKKFSKEDATSSVKDGGGGCSNNSELGRMTIEIFALKEANRILEEKIQICTEAERRKTSDIRELKDSYEIRLTQISKSAKTEINRLLEEIKSKERNIGQLKKEVQSLKSSTSNKRDTIRNAQHPPEMRKLKDIERTNSTNSSNQKCLNTTCGNNEFNSVPHEITERILEAHNDLHLFGAKDSTSSDTDSALSSAPQSISPQPPANGIDTRDIWQSVNGYAKELENLQKINEEVQKENESLKMELNSAKEQILDLEKTALDVEAHKSSKMQQLLERLKYLEHKENILMKESHELREQNELLEFRILELEESHDKWSLRSNSTPDTRDMWTDTEKESDDLLIYTDRSDSGITSPHSHHHIDDRNIASPCDLSLLDQVSNDEVKRRIAAMTKKPNIDEEDKFCLLQVLTLINNLEMLSQDSLLVSDDIMSLELVKSKSSDYSGSASSSPRTLLTDVQPLQKSKRIVATVLPYSSSLSTPTDSPRRFRSWNSGSLQESGVFEGDSFYSQETQTDPEDFPPVDAPATGDLCAEIQKLNKFREKIEEVVTKQSTKAPVTVPTILSPNLSDQRRLQYYKDRLELLENKILIYESSGDLQTKRLAERLQREIQLESLAKELRQRVENLEAENLQLEEERCEFEEAENDTRLRLQRLEVDLEILNQRNIELDMSREAVQNKLKEAKNQCANLQESIQENQEKIKEIEGERQNLRSTLGLLKTSMPALVLFGALMVHGNSLPVIREEEVQQQCVCHAYSQESRVKKEEEASQMCASNADRHEGRNMSQQPSSIYRTASRRPLSPFRQLEDSGVFSGSFRMGQRCDELLPKKSNCYDIADKHDLQNQLHQLMDREKELTQNITELNRAYQETMENADVLWEQIEKDYREKLIRAEEVEQCLKMKVVQLEQRLSNDATCAQERLSQLEENEMLLKHKIYALHKQNKDLIAEHEELTCEYNNTKEELCKLKTFIEGPGHEALEREKRKVRELEDDTCILKKMICGMEEEHKKELCNARNQLCKAHKNLENIEVTNSELKEEVCTLENKICELQKEHKCDEEKIQCLMDEIKVKEENIEQLRMCLETCRESGSKVSLAQEMDHGSTGKRTFETMMGDGPTSGRIDFCEVKDLRTASQKLYEALENMANCSKCAPVTQDLQAMACDVRHFSDNIRKAIGDKVSEDDDDEECEDEDDDDGDEGGDKGGDRDVGESGDSEERGEGKVDKEGGGKQDEPETGESEGDTPEKEPTAQVTDDVTVAMALTSAVFEEKSSKKISQKHSKTKAPVPSTSKFRDHFSKTKSISRKLLSRKVTKKTLQSKDSEAEELCKYNKSMVSSTSLGSRSDSIVSILRKLKDVFTGGNISRSSRANATQQTDIDDSHLMVPEIKINKSKESVEQFEGSPKNKAQINFQDPVEELELPSESFRENPVEFFEVPDDDEKSEKLMSVDNLGVASAETSLTKSPISKPSKIKLKKKSRLEKLFELVRGSVSELDQLENAESSLKRLYKSDKVFKENLKITLRLRKEKEVKSNEDVLKALTCLKVIEDMYKPTVVPAIKRLEAGINSKLLEYHKNLSQPKLYCPVYYPENRAGDIVSE